MGEFGFTPRSDDGSLPPDWPPTHLYSLLIQALKQAGRLSPGPESLQTLLQDAGFTDIQLQVFKLPSNPWPKSLALKQAGALNTMSGKTGYEAYCLQLLTKMLGMGEEEVVRLCKEAFLAQVDRKAGVHAYWE